MPIAVCACTCGSTSDKLARNFLKEHNYPDWLGIDIPKGRERSRRLLNSIPQFPEVKEIDKYLDNVSKWCIIIGWNENAMRWSDIGHYNIKSRTEAQHIVETFA